MTISISKLTIAELDAVDELMKRHSNTLGFLPKEALRSYLAAGNTLGAKSDDGKLIGYLLHATNPNYFRIAQLCVAEDFKGRGIARRFINELINIAETQKDIRLRCRNDFPAHHMWPKLGFSSIDEQPGRSKEKHPLTLWHLPLAPDNQLDLFQAKTSDESLDVVIDAQIFFDFDETDSDKSRPSKTLLSDFFVDELRLLITYELFNEIRREKDPEQLEKSRNRAHEFPKIDHNPQLAEQLEEVLRTFLPSKSPSQQSDIRQLAKAAASEVKIFVTRDQGLLNKSEEIADKLSLQVVSPTELIIQLHELSEKQSYAPTRVAGFELQWQRLSSDHVAHFPYSSFLSQGQRQGVFRVELDALLASPDLYTSECLQSKDEIVAVRVLARDSDKTLHVPMMRIARSANDRSLLGRFVISDTIAKAVEENRDMVKVDVSALSLGLEPDLLEMGFIKGTGCFVRFCFSRHLTRTEVLSEIHELFPEAVNNYQHMQAFELQRCCSPLNLKDTGEDYFLIPIRPGYALSLFDRRQSASDLFGGEVSSVLLRWDNVYYRTKTHHHILRPPARILWYESGGEKKQIVAISCLDTVEIDAATKLFRKFKKFGALKWQDIFDMCGGDHLKEIMALRFSHTFLFRKPVSLDTMRKVYDEHGTNLVLQSPSRIPTEVFCKLFQLGYPDKL